MADYSGDDQEKMKPKGVDEDRLSAIVSQQIQLAKDHDSRNRANDRAKNLDYYMGDMTAYVPAESGRSKVVSRDFADTVGWMLPGIMRVFVASDRMAMAEPTSEEETQFATEATDGMNYVFWKDNPGYQILYSASWDSMVFGNGVVKTWYDDTPVYKVSFLSDLSEDQLALLMTPDDEGEAPEILAQTEKKTQAADPESGQMIDAPAFDVKIRHKTAPGKFVMEALAPEKFLIDGDAITTEDAAFTAHWERKTRSDLVEMGYDKDIIWSLPEATRTETPEEAARLISTDSVDQSDKSMQLVDYYECFIRIDIDEDGEAELLRVCFGGNANGKLLDWEVWEDEHPFDDIPCDPVPHRWTARSIGDETMDVQDVKTVLSRQALNNIYATNNPQRHVAGKVDNPDELFSPSFGGVVFSSVGTTINDLAVPFVANHAFEAMLYQDEVVTRRTGVARTGMALDPDTLQNQTATAAQKQSDAQYSQVELIARNMAEWGWKKVFRKLMRLMIKHQGPRRLMMNNKPIQIDPRFWNADMDVTINVGLGTGSRDRDLMMLQQVLGTQMGLADRFMASGAPQEAIDMLPKIIRTMTKMAESAGIRNPEDFYPEYTKEKVAELQKMAQEQAAQPDPKIKLEEQKMQIDAQSKQQSAQLDQAKAQQDIQIDREKMENDIILQREKMQGEMALKQYQIQAEMELKREQLAAELQLKRELSMQEMSIKREQGFYHADAQAEVGKYKADATSRVSMGGEPG